jgi:serine/threonine protein kinase/formylglycine-generating enzyme required for sulfatase activity
MATVSHGRTTSPPIRIGRYTVQGTLGHGGFGTVYLAHDQELNRPVAIKVPVAGQMGSENRIASLLKEAQLAAGLRHAGIVTIYDVGRLANGECYFVMEYVPGQTLGETLAQQPLTCRSVADLVIEVGDALHHAHERGLVHRDLKPSNVLIDMAGHPRITDFGLAIEERYQHLLAGQIAGTAAYMAPEQVRGESHRLDARTDLWSLGVILYELLTRRRPFLGRREEVFDAVLHREPVPPRGIHAGVPRELERICLKCLAKRMSDRYPTAAALGDDLRHWRGGLEALADVATVGNAGRPSDDSSRSLVQVLPKGLRSFDVQDADYFPHLLPGPRDRHGLPDGLTFWKARLEETDADQTFNVGLIYGPSGCGKTSLVKAGVLPRLAPHVSAVYLEATPDSTEARVLAGLRKRRPDLPQGLTLVPTLAALREGEGLGPGHKVVLIIDQFEQWLHAHRDAHDTELVRALRQCDGGRVQCVLLVRDDFWMAISAFFRDLEVHLNEGKNSAPVSLFSPRHARKVLAQFGRAFGCLPDLPDETTPEQGRFLDQAVAELARGDEIIPVQLSLFAEMIKTRAWVPNTLRDMGGPRGLGVTFLEETFDSAAAPPGHRKHARAARAVLKALLPDRGTDIKGALRSRATLLAASGYGDRPRDFDDLLRILDQELRLVTPADPEAGAGGPAYQLTHDYLVPSLREWLTRKQKESWRGRAELVLEERAAQWGRSHDGRFLLSPKEYLAVRFGVPRKVRTDEQKALVRASGRRHGLRLTGVLAVVLTLAALLQQYLSSVRHTDRQDRAEALVEAVLRAAPEGVPYGVEGLRPLHDLAVPLLRAHFEDASLDFRHRLHAAVVLAAFGEVEEDFLLDSLATAPASEGQNVLAALAPARETAAAKVRERLGREAEPRVRLRLAATLLQLGDATAAQKFLVYGPDPADRVAFIHDFASWRGDLGSLPELLRGSDDPALRSGLCAALGMISPDLLSAAQLEPLQIALCDIYRHAPDAGTHSAAGWALRRWGARLPALESNAAPGAGRQWFVNRQGMTLLAIAPGAFKEGDFECSGARPRPVNLTQAFSLCDREVTLDQFRQFLADPDPSVEKPHGWVAPDAQVAPSGDCPVVKVKWEDTLLFCNWLSRREQRQPCYERLGKKKKDLVDGKPVVFDVWRCDFAADGYRLPTEAEWEYACRAGTTTHWSFGDDEGRLASFAVFRQPHLAPGGTRLPNNWGLFDMHGNAREWCWDGYSGTYPAGPAQDPRGPTDPGASRLHRGGSWWDYPHACRSGYRNMSPCQLADNLVGFRVARGMPNQPKTAGGNPPP